MNKDNYDEGILGKIKICDSDILSKNFEQFAYYALEEDQIGFFLTDKDNSTIYASMVIDLTCSKYAKLLEINERNVNKSFEITLLCANKEHVKKGLTRHFFHYILHTLINQYMPNPENIVLYLGGGKENQVALRFYTGLGFKDFVDEKNVLIYEYPRTSPQARKTSETIKRKTGSKKKIKMKQVRRTFKKTFKKALKKKYETTTY